MTTVARYGWTHELDMLRSRAWVQYADLMGWANQLVSTNRSIQQRRDQLIAAYEGLSKTAPFSTTSRFPAEGVWIDVSEQQLAELINAIILGLSTHDRNQNINLGQGPVDSTSRYAFQAKQDASRQLQKNVDALNAYIAPGEAVETLSKRGIYTQATFESRWKLTWA